MMPLKKNFLFTLLSICLVQFAIAQTNERQEIVLHDTLYGMSINVADGDTFTLLLDDKQKIKIRLEGIDAPEKGMPFAKKAKEELATLLLGKRLLVKSYNYDQYHRLIARVFVGSADVSKSMLKAGLGVALQEIQ